VKEKGRRPTYGHLIEISGRFREKIDALIFLVFTSRLQLLSLCPISLLSGPAAKIFDSPVLSWGERANCQKVALQMDNACKDHKH
jgi:hypothetical protein